MKKPYEQQYFCAIYNRFASEHKWNTPTEQEFGIILEDNRRSPSPPIDVIMGICYALYVKKSSYPHLDELLKFSPVDCREIIYIDSKKIKHPYWQVGTLLYDETLRHRLWQPYMDLEQSVFVNKHRYDCTLTTDRMEDDALPLDLGPRYRMYEVNKLILDADALDQIPLEQRLIFSLRSKMDCEMYIHESILPIFSSIQLEWFSIDRSNAAWERSQEREKENL